MGSSSCDPGQNMELVTSELLRRLECHRLRFTDWENFESDLDLKTQEIIEMNDGISAEELIQALSRVQGYGGSHPSDSAFGWQAMLILLIGCFLGLYFSGFDLRGSKDKEY